MPSSTATEAISHRRFSNARYGCHTSRHAETRRERSCRRAEPQTLNPSSNCGVDAHPIPCAPTTRPSTRNARSTPACHRSTRKSKGRQQYKGHRKKNIASVSAAYEAKMHPKLPSAAALTSTEMPARPPPDHNSHRNHSADPEPDSKPAWKDLLFKDCIVRSG